MWSSGFCRGEACLALDLTQPPARLETECITVAGRGASDEEVSHRELKTREDFAAVEGLVCN